MKSPHPQDPVRLEVTEANVRVSLDRSEIVVSVEFRYDPWEPSAAMDQLWEQANALTAVKNVLDKGGLGPMGLST